MIKRVMTPEKLEEAIALRRRSWSIESIATHLGVSRGTIDWHFLKEGVEPPKPQGKSQPPRTTAKVISRGNHAVRLFTDEEDQRLLHMEAQGIGYSAMAHALGRKPNSIRGRLMCLARREARGEGVQAAE